MTTPDTPSPRPSSVSGSIESPFGPSTPQDAPPSPPGISPGSSGPAGVLPSTEACERERLHLSGAIQPHGALIVFGGDGIVRHVSANTADFFGQSPDALLGRPVPERLAQLAEALGMNAGARDSVEAAVMPGGRRCDLVLARNAARDVTVEAYPAGEAMHALGADAAPPTLLPSSVWPGAGTSNAWDAGWDESDPLRAERPRQQLVERIMSLTGFTRVMYYEFVDNSDGVVVAEARDPQAYGSYLGLRFPASDIPRIARALYASNPWRLIPDAAAASVPLHSTSPQPPDLTYCDLRSVSPVHAAYLHNMHVRASMSLPVFLRGELAALVSCHHGEPRRPSQAAMRAAARIVEDFNQRLTLLRSQAQMRLLEQLDAHADAFAAQLREHGSLARAWPAVAPRLLEALAADGVVLLGPEADGVPGVGLVPGQAVLDALINHVELFVERRPLWHSDTLGMSVPEFDGSGLAGAMVVRWRDPSGHINWLVLLRRELIHEVDWGGRPDKPPERLVDGQAVLSPRHSFDRWIERRSGSSRPWVNPQTLLALRLRRTLLAHVEPAASS